MISEQHVQQFVQQGALTIDTPLSPRQIAAASTVLDELLPFREPATGQTPRDRVGTTSPCDCPELVDIIQHSFFEAVAKRVLGCDEVRFFQSGITTSYPQPKAAFGCDQHVDIQYCLADLDALPRRMICSFFLWISDVNERRAPLMYRPGSHRLIAAYREHQLHLKGTVPVVKGVWLKQLPALSYASAIPAVARSGQVTVLTTAMVHGASVNVDQVARKAMIITFTARGVEIGLPSDQAAAKRSYDRELARRVRLDRRHLVGD